MPVPTSIDELSITPSENFPLGTEQVFPNLDNYLRFQAACIAQLRDRIAAEGLPLATVLWHGGNRSSIAVRLAPLDGQAVNRVDYPALWAMVSAGGYPLESDATWSANPARRASFSSGNGSTTFRMPDLNGKSGSGAIGSATLRGDGAFSAGGSGLMQDGQNASHGHSLTIDAAGSHTHQVNDPGHSHTFSLPTKPNYPGGGPIAMLDGSSPVTGSYGNNTTATGAGIWLSAAGHHGHSGSIAASGGDEARMKSATGVWVMRVK